MRLNKSMLFILVLCNSFVSMTLFSQNRDLFTRTSKKGTAIIPKDEIVLKSYNAIANINLLRSSQLKSISVLLPNGDKVILLPKRTENLSKNNMIWNGQIEKDPGSLVVLSVVKNAITGHITTSKGESIRITYIGNNVHQVAQIDPSKFEEKELDYIKTETKGGPVILSDCPDSPESIDIMVVYTDAAETGAGGADGMEALIYECIYRTNLAYENSDVNQRIRLVHFSKVTYTETANSETDLIRLRDNGDSQMDNVHTLRNIYAADAVILLLESTEENNCGRAYYMDPISSGFEDRAFGVVRRSCASSNLSFPHELGHIMGANHNCNGSETGSQYGHFVSNPADGSGQSWRTIMSYRNCSPGSGSCTRIHHFSNPSVSYSPTGSASTDPTGTSGGSCSSNVRSRFNASASTVANFRCSSPGVTNVWMKDTWQDTGLEPDPNTVGQNMWISPYIWVRNTQDPTFLHQHDHQNPELGSTNWVYIKIHNGNTASQAGNLELYYANASVSLSWMGSWTLLGTIPVTLSPNSTKVLEQAWSSLPETGHFCLLARWVSATDPMATTETTNINANTRNNNNIVWRNLNIVDLLANDDIEVSLNVSNLTGFASQIVFEEYTKFPTRSFFNTGQVIITPEETLLKIWTKGKAKPVGLKAEGKSFIMTRSLASLDNLFIPFNYRGKIKIKFKKTKLTPNNVFDFSVKQFVFRPKSKKSIVGGVDYTIRNFLK